MDLNELNDPDIKGDNLGSLAQSIRESDLNQARNILLFIGIVTLAVNGFMFAGARSEVATLGLPAGEFDRILLLVRLIYGVGLALGTFFVVAGILVKKFPVPLTILSLVVYVGSVAGFGMLDPKTLVSGLLIKVFIVIALGNAVKTAIAYQKAKQSHQ